MSEQSLPGQKVEYTPTLATNDNDQWMHLVAPSDGWFAVATGMSGFFADVESSDRYGACISSIGQNGPGAQILPVRSGEAIDIHIYVNAMPSDGAYVRFFPTVGNPSS